MKINLGTVLMNIITDTPLMETEGKVLTLNFVVMESLARPMAEGTNPIQMVERFDLIRKVKKADVGIVDLKSEQVSLIKDLIVKAFLNPLFSGPAIEAMEEDADDELPERPITLRKKR